MKKLLVLFLCFLSWWAKAQYTPSNAHSHNDYLQISPFRLAYEQGFGSVEADVFLRNDSLFVAHEYGEIESGRTFEALYLHPVLEVCRKNNGSIYADKSRQLQLLIDLKTDYAATLPALVKRLDPYQEFLYPRGTVKVVISGSTPKPEEFSNYPGYIFFDGRPEIDYTPVQLRKVGLISQSFRNYSLWNGKGIPVEKERQVLAGIVHRVHALNKPLRFWATPDTPNAWKFMMNLGVDYVNTDKVQDLGRYLGRRKSDEFQNTEFHEVYLPAYRNNDTYGRVKNIILLIGDGMGLTQVQAGLTANRGMLNLGNIRNIGLSATEATDNYITDSAAGGTAIATGSKTHNRAIGVDSADRPLESIATTLRRRGMKTALISCGDITDATPAAFYAHQPDRGMSREIARDFLDQPSDILIGGGEKWFLETGTAEELKKKGYGFSTQWSDLPLLKTPFVLLNQDKTGSVLNGRGRFLTEAFRKTVNELKDSEHGFFLMAEGAQIDYGGHANDLPYVVTEMLDFDQLVGEALRFADANGETLVIVTADHETGGLTLLDGDTRKGYVDGQFSTSDHTGVMVPVFAYGPHSLDFRGMYPNTGIYDRLVKVLAK